MEKDDKGCSLIRLGVRGWVFLLVPAYPSCPGQKLLNGCVCVCVQRLPILIQWYNAILLYDSFMKEEEEE